MTNTTYAGSWTALITPFKKNGDLDEDAVRRLVHKAIEGGMTGVVPVGTTGESPTTTGEEDKRIIEICVEEAVGRIRVMAGTGSNCTWEAVKYTETAKEAGAECCLVVCPYYNKPTPEGLKLHYKAVADVGIPVIVYNIEGRTGTNIRTDTLMEIAEHPNIVGVKEASGNIEQIKEVLARRSGDFTVLSGDDKMTFSLMREGGDGVISVAANIAPHDVSKLVNLCATEKWKEAEEHNSYLADMFKMIFIETNPMPVKYCASRMGLCENVFRLPMCPPTQKSQKILDTMLKNYGLVS